LNFLRHDLVEKKFAENQLDDSLTQEEILTQIIKAEALVLIKQAIEALPEGCRTVLKLAFFEGLKNEQIALELGISINTVKTQKQRALQLLRLKLSDKAYLLLLFLLPL
jgi:RNA polymerase sigma-70 factor (ECF subfamily)